MIEPLRSALRFDDARAQDRYQAETNDSKINLLLKMLAAESAIQSGPKWWFTAADKERLRAMRAVLPGYLRRHPIRPLERRGPEPTFKSDTEWRAVNDVRTELNHLFKRAGSSRQSPESIAAIFIKHLPERRDLWMARAEKHIGRRAKVRTYADDISAKPHLRTESALSHFLDLSWSAISKSIARARRQRS